MNILDENLEIAIKASLAAGKEIIEIYDSPIEVSFKDDKSPLTEADKKGNDIINSFLKRTSIPIISEESSQADYVNRKIWDKCWLVDPLDGTKEFINRNGEFTVNIALIENGNPQLGVIYVPVKKTIYYANVRSKKAFKSKLTSHTFILDDLLNNSIQLKPKNEETKNLKIVGSRSHMNRETFNFIKSLEQDGRCIEIISVGSSLKFCLVAEGNADMYPRYAPTMEWDTAAGHAICNAVGINVTSFETSLPLSYNKEELKNPGFLVSKIK